MARFQLRWKLALSYMTITTSILVVVEACILGLVLLIAWYYQVQRPSFTTDVISRQIQSTLQSMSHQDLTPSTVDSWLQWIDDGTLPTDPQALNVLTQQYGSMLKSFTPPDSMIIVLDPDLRVLGTLGQIQAPTQLRSVDWPNHHFADLTAAIMQDEQSATARGIYEQGRFHTVIPMLNTQQQLRGLVLVTYPTMFYSLSVANWLPLLGFNLLIFLIGSGLSGILFGRLVARPLVRRLQIMADGATAWASGDFVPQIHDPSQDEVGRLGRQLNRMAVQLHELLETQRDLSRIQERNRVAQDLHDSVKQQMFAMTMNLGTIQALWDTDPALARERLDIAFQVARQCQQELHAVITTLQPIALAQEPVAHALRTYLDLWSQQTGITTDYTPPTQSIADDTVAVAILRIAQEALANVARHSGAAHVTVQFHVESTTVHLIINDNGHGFDPTAVVLGLGLRSMRERAASCNGIMLLTSSPTGTQLELTIPVPTTTPLSDATTRKDSNI